MSNPQTALTRRKLTTPRSAAVAGILFALLYGSSVALIRLAIPTDSTGDTGDWLQTRAKSIDLALNLVPFAGIAFLWFIGVIRDRLGDLEDRFFATVFLGSGLLFLGLTFTGAAMAGGLLTSFAIAPDDMVASGVFVYGREVMFHIINIYAIRMAGVFMFSLGTIWLRTGLMYRGWAILTYTLAVILLVSISLSLWVTLIFPGWVLAISVYFLLRIRGEKSTEAAEERGAR